MGMAKVREAEFYYELHGSKQNKPLVLITGYGADHTYWTPILAELSEHYYVLVFDNRAVGQTKDDGVVSLTIESMAEDTVALARSLKLENPHIIGQSMGGAIAQVVAAKYPQYVDRVCIMNAPIKWRENVLCGLKAMHLSYKEGATFENLFQANLAWVFGCKFIGNKVKVEELRHTLQNAAHPQTVEDQARQFCALERFNGLEYVKLIRSPTLVIYGDEDIICPPKDIDDLTRVLQSSDVVELTGAAHAPHLEDAEGLLSALKGFFLLSELRPRL